MNSEKKIIESCQQGDKKAQYILVDKYSRMLLTICRRYARDDSMAKDLLQETFLKIFTAIYDYKQVGSFEGWMKKIALNCCLQWISKSQFKNESYPLTLLENSEEPAILDFLATEEIIQKIQQLPQGYRTVLNLYIVEGYSHKEIAKMLKISIGTSRSQLLRGKSKLIKILKNLPINILA